MFQNHLLLMVVYAAFVAVVGGVLLKDRRSEQLRTGGGIFGGLVGAAVIAGWLLYVLPL
jgi:preprotein translocase subunit SecG